MKALKKFALLGLVAPLVFALLSFNAIAGNDIVIIRTYEFGGVDTKIVISAKEKSSEVALEKAKNNAAIDATNQRNMNTIAATLEQFYKEGYKIESTNSVAAVASYFLGANGGMVPGPTLITTYILTK